MVKNYSKDSENDLFITPNTLQMTNYNFDISENDQFLLHAAQGLQTIGNINKKTVVVTLLLNSRFVQQSVLFLVHSYARIHCFNNRVTSLLYFNPL